jgi:hypothetical protein
MVTTLPVVEELYPINFKSLDFAKKTPWSQYAINLGQVVNKILNK